MSLFFAWLIFVLAVFAGAFLVYWFFDVPSNAPEDMQDLLKQANQEVTERPRVRALK